VPVGAATKSADPPINIVVMTVPTDARPLMAVVDAVFTCAMHAAGKDADVPLIAVAETLMSVDCPIFGTVTDHVPELVVVVVRIMRLTLFSLVPTELYTAGTTVST
jgi:hypothetical protein